MNTNEKNNQPDKSLDKITKTSIKLPPTICKDTLYGMSNRSKKYTEELGESFALAMATGMSKTAACVIVGIHPDTMREWSNSDSPHYIEEFYEWLRLGETFSLAWWEEVGRLNLGNKEFNSTLYMMNMQNRHNWTRKLEGKLEQVNTEKKEIEVKIDDATEGKLARIAEILHECGAIPSSNEIIEKQ